MDDSKPGCYPDCDALSLKFDRESQNGKWTGILNTLKNGSCADQIVSLTELSQLLSYSNEECLLGFPAWSFMKVLLHNIESPTISYSKVNKSKSNSNESETSRRSQLSYLGLISAIYDLESKRNDEEVGEDTGVEEYEHPDECECYDHEMLANKMIISATCINTILDILPHSSKYFGFNTQYLEVLNNKMADLQYIDLAEKILMIFQKLSREVPLSVIKSGAMSSMLQFIDFFPLDVQITTLNSMSNMIKNVDCVDTFKKFIIPIIPFMSQFLSTENDRMIQIITVLWKELIDISLKISKEDESALPDFLNEVIHYSVLESLLRIISLNKLRKINVSYCIHVISVISTLSTDLLDVIFKLDGLNYFNDLITKCSHVDVITMEFLELGIALLGNSLTISNDCKYLNYYNQHTIDFIRLLDMYPVQELLRIYDLSLSQKLKYNILFLLLKLIDMSSRIGEKMVLPPRVVELISLTLMYPNDEKNVIVSIHIINVLLRDSSVDYISVLNHYSIPRSIRNIKIGCINDIVDEITMILGDSEDSQTSFKDLADLMMQMKKDEYINIRSLPSLLLDNEDVGNVLKSVMDDPSDLLHLWNSWIKLFEWNMRDEEDETNAENKPESSGTVMRAMDLLCNLKEEDGEDDYLKRIKTAINVLQKYIKRDDSLFPFNYLNRDVKFRLKMLEQDDELKLPTIALFTHSTISATRLEGYILKFVNEKSQDRSITSRKRAKTYITGSTPSNEFIGAQIYLKGILLAPRISIYHALARFNFESKFELCHTLSFKLLKKNDFSYLNYRYGPVLTLIPNDVYSPASLYVDLLSYISCSIDVVINSSAKSTPLCTTGPEDCLRDSYTSENSSCPEYSTLAEGSKEADEQPVGLCTTNDDFESQFYDFNLNEALKSMGGFDVSTLERNLKIIASTMVQERLSVFAMDSKRLDYVMRGERGYRDLLLSACYINVGAVYEDIMPHLKVLSTISSMCDFNNTDNLMASKRMTMILLSKMSDVRNSLSYNMPSWVYKIPLICPMLFSYESRQILFDILTKDPQRLLQLFIDRIKGLSDGSRRISDVFDECLSEYFPDGMNALKDDYPQVSRFKAIVNRNNLLNDAIKVFSILQDYTGFDSVPRLEIEYKDEAGTGSGPTQEFYSLVVESILNYEDGLLFHNSQGYYFPSAQKIGISNVHLLKFMTKSSITDDDESTRVSEEKEPEASKIEKIFIMFKTLGQICAYALLDDKLLDLPLHRLFWHYIKYPLDQVVNIDNMSEIYPTITRSLLKLKDVDVESLGLTFTYDDLPLINHGHDLLVTNDNLQEYVNAVMMFKLDIGIRLQVWAFRFGFSMVLPLYSLWLYTDRELSDVVYSNGILQDDYWKIEHLRAFILPDHGFDANSDVYNNLIDILSELTTQERRLFLRFCTGAPILPKMGFGGLTGRDRRIKSTSLTTSSISNFLYRPNMRVVKKDDGASNLPSVMTCTNYLKLPDYETKDELRCKLLQAINEGQCSFNLS